MDLQSEQINELAAALAIAQGVIGKAEKDKINPHYKSPYASYESIRQECQKALSSNGLSITHMLSINDKGRVLITQVTHKSGQWIRSLLQLPTSDKETPQGIGSSITYAKRYSLSALLCIGTGEDDDAETAEQEVKSSNNKKPEALASRMISPEEARYIENLIPAEDAIFRENLLDHIAKRCNKNSIQSFEQAPHSMFQDILNSVNQRSLNRAKK